MSGGDRGERPAYLKGDFLAIAILVTILIVGALSYHSGRQNERRTYEPHQHGISAADAAQERCAGREPGAMAECIIKEIAAAEETARDEQDLQAQQNMALWALLMVIVSAATVGITVWALTYIKETLDETRKMAGDTNRMADEAHNAARAARDAVTETQRIGEAQVRCYLSGISAKIGFTPSGQVMITCVVKNSGQSPAIRTRGTGYLMLSGGGVSRRFDNEHAAYPRFLLDISSGAENELTFCLEADLTAADLSGVDKDTPLIVILRATFHATDVFNLPVQGSERFVAFLHVAPSVNDWIDLLRQPHIADVDDTG